jgi:O-antigen/teichoic acid export membrane protein
LYVLVFALMPVLALVVFRSSALSMLTAMGVAAALCAMAFAPFKELRTSSLRQLRVDVSKLLRYSAPRAIGSVALLVLFAAPSMSAARSDSLGLAGLLAFSVTVVGSLGSMVGPVGTILLPKASRAAAVGRMGALLEEYRMWSILVVASGAIATLSILFSSDAILSFFVPFELRKYSTAFRYCVAGALPYMYFSLARHVIDAYAVRPHNAYAAVAALACYFAVEFILGLAVHGSNGVAQGAALACAMLVLAVWANAMVRRMRFGVLTAGAS